MRIIGFMVCGPGEADRWLKPVLEQRKELVDDMIIATNNADKKTKDLIKKFGFWQYEDNREWGIYQPRIKDTLLEKVGKLKPDWILASDADEIYDKNFTREEAEKLALIDTFGYYFAIMTLWGDEEHYRHDASFWNIRFWNYNKTKKFGLYFEKKKLHCGLAPPIVYKYGMHAPFLLKHYGLMKEGDREKKAERYDKYDPNAVYKGREFYDKLRDKPKRVQVFNEDAMHQKVAEDVKSFKEPIKQP